MGRISDALARAKGRPRLPASHVDEPQGPWSFDAAIDAARADRSDDREIFLSERPSSSVHGGVPQTPSQPAAAAPPASSPSKLVAHAPRVEPATIPVAPEIAARLVLSPELPAQVKEQYRRLAATLHQAQREDGVRVLMVASALPNEGKTLVSANLALTLSRSYGRRVLLIDGDLRKPSLHGVFGLPGDQPGLSDCLKAGSSGVVTPIALNAKLSLVGAGHHHGDSMRVVSSGVMQRVIQEAVSSFDWVILDTPPLGLLADAHVLAAMVDRILFVINAGKTPYDLIQRAIEVVGRERVIGTVLNRATRSEVSPGGYEYDNYYGSDGGSQS